MKLFGSGTFRHRPFTATAALTAAGLLTAGGLAAAQAGAARTGPTEPAASAAGHRVLFDNSKAETAGNADWVISTSQPDPLGEDAAPSAETDWTGALSSWGVALQRTGDYTVRTLPSGSSISYGTSSATDLQNFDTFVLPEPNVLFTAAEKTAIMKFVQNGGGLFMVSDHDGADRNNDGADAVEVLNDLMTDNSVDSDDPFGFSIDAIDAGDDDPKAIADSTDPVLHGSFGDVTGSIIRNGATATLNPSDNSAVKGLVYRTGYSGNSGAFFATSTFGSGRVAFWGDSSPVDDGTGDSGDTLYDGWNDPAGTNAELALNATEWLAGGSDGGTTDGGTTTGGDTGGGDSCTAAQLLRNPGFESGATAWSASSGVITDDSAEPARSGSYKAWLVGYGTTTTNTLSQSVTIPSGCSARLGFYLHIDTDETGSTVWDTLKAEVLSSSGSSLKTLATYSNTDAASGYQQRTFDLSAYAGQTVTLRFTGTEGSKLQTSFVIDDTAIDVG